MKESTASYSVEIFGAKMHYVEMGDGDPIVFLHGIPTSSYVWRNVMPHLSSLGRAVAPDLIGFGESEKPNISYSIFDHISYFEQFMNTLNLRNVTLVMHGWGSVIGFDYAMKNPKNCKGLVFYEAFLHPIDLDDISLPYQEQLATLNEQMKNISNGTDFIDRIIPQTIMRELTDEEMSHYRKPFLAKNSAKPIVQYLSELPNGITKSKVDTLIAAYSNKLCHSSLPKLMLYSLPGFITTMASVMWAKEHLPNIEVVEIGEELHLAQESCPELMSESISIWMQAIEQAHI